MNVLALTFGDETCASSLYRIFQYREELLRHDIQLEIVTANEFAAWDGLGRYDVVILQKRLFGGGIVKRLRAGARRLVYDIDDAIWLPHDRPHHWLTRWRTDRRLKAIAKAADVCLAANDLLRRKLAEVGGNARVLPMSLDDQEWIYKEDIPKRLRVGWIGSPPNLPYLEAIETELTQVQAAHPDLEFCVNCGVAPKLSNGLRYTHIPYRPGTEAENVRSFDIGLLPLPDNPFAAGKSPIKALQYMASGAVPIASPIGATCEMFRPGKEGLHALEPGDWFHAISQLAEDRELLAGMKQAARQRFQEHYSLSRNADQLARLLKSLGGPADGRSES
ncbi:MAG: glycosyltransferase family 4 protein [Limisphaerales bacterium]